jgi:hypothetical protein
MQPSENPYASPTELIASSPAGLAARERAKKRLYIPGLVMIICGLLGIPITLVRVFVFALPDIQQNPDDPDTGHRLLVLCMFMQIGSLFCILGGIQMIRVRTYGACVAAVILLILPCTSPLMLLGWIIGIWALIALIPKDTRSAFFEAE